MKTSELGNAFNQLKPYSSHPDFIQELVSVSQKINDTKSLIKDQYEKTHWVSFLKEEDIQSVENEYHGAALYIALHKLATHRMEMEMQEKIYTMRQEIINKALIILQN